MTILDRKCPPLTFTHEEALSIRMAVNETGSGWTSRGHEARAAGDNEGAETCYRIAARYSAIWDRVAEAMNAPAPACETFAAPRGDNGGLLALRPGLRWFDEAAL